MASIYRPSNVPCCRSWPPHPLVSRISEVRSLNSTARRRLTYNRWLIDHGRSEEGLRVLAKLHAHGNDQDAWVLAEFEQIQESITYEHENEAKSYMELFKSRSAFRKLLIAVSLQASVQMTGVSAIQYYSVEIFAQIGISSQDSLKYQAINSIIALIAEGLCMAFIDKFGRRWTLISGNIGNCITFIVATILLAKFPPAVVGIPLYHCWPWPWLILVTE